MILRKQRMTFQIHHLEEACVAVDVELTAEEAAFLEEPYVPHEITGHS